MQLKSSDPDYLEHVDRWFEVLLRIHTVLRTQQGVAQAMPGLAQCLMLQA